MRVAFEKGFWREGGAEEGDAEEGVEGREDGVGRGWGADEEEDAGGGRG